LKSFRMKLSVLMVITLLFATTSVFAADSSETKIDTRSDIQIVNDALNEKGFEELKSSDVEFLEKDGQWNKIVNYFREDNNLIELDYKVILFDNGSLAVVPKDCNVIVSTDESKKDNIIEENSSNNTNSENDLGLVNTIAADDTYYGRGRFDGYMYSSFTITDKQITTTGMKIWYHYKCDTAHSITPSCDSNYYYYYCSSTSPSTYTYNTVQFTDMVNGTYSIQYSKDASGFQANCYGEIGDGPI